MSEVGDLSPKDIPKKAEPYGAIGQGLYRRLLTLKDSLGEDPPPFFRHEFPPHGGNDKTYTIHWLQYGHFPGTNQRTWETLFSESATGESDPKNATHIKAISDVYGSPDGTVLITITPQDNKKKGINFIPNEKDSSKGTLIVFDANAVETGGVLQPNDPRRQAVLDQLSPTLDKIETATTDYLKDNPIKLPSQN